MTEVPIIELGEGGDEAERIEGWRLHCLLEAGYPAPIAAHLARRHEIDLHGAVELLEQGCPPELASEILI